MRGSLVEVRLSEDELEERGETTEATDDPTADVEPVWRRAEVRKDEPGLGGAFQVCIHTLAGEADEGFMRWCTAWDENDAWRRIEGQPLFARTKPGKRRGRCGECAGCTAKDCGTCSACRDKPKFGGPGTAKQACVKRRCSNPTLPIGEEATEENAAGGARSHRGKRAHTVDGDPDDDGGSLPPEYPSPHIVYSYTYAGFGGFASDDGLPAGGDPSVDDSSIQAQEAQEASGGGIAPLPETDDVSWDVVRDEEAEQAEQAEQAERAERAEQAEQAEVSRGHQAEGGDADPRTGQPAGEGLESRRDRRPPEDTMDQLRAQVLQMHRHADRYRQRAEEVMRAANTLYPLAMAYDANVGCPSCFTDSLPQLFPPDYVLQRSEQQRRTHGPGRSGHS